MAPSNTETKEFLLNWRAVLALTLCWFSAGFFSRLNSNVTALFSFLSIVIMIYITLITFKRMRSKNLSFGRSTRGLLALSSALLASIVFAPIGISISESVKPLTQEEIQERERQESNQSDLETSEMERESQSVSIPRNQTEKSLKPCNPSEFNNCYIQGSLLIDSTFLKASFDSSTSFICTKHRVEYTNIADREVIGIKGYFVMEIYFMETFTPKLKPGNYVLSDKYGVPRAFAMNRRLLEVNLEKGETFGENGQYCDALASENSDLDTAMVHLKGISKVPWKMSFVLDEIHFDDGTFIKQDNDWILNLCTTNDLEWAVRNSDTKSNCKVSKY